MQSAFTLPSALPDRGRAVREFVQQGRAHWEQAHRAGAPAAEVARGLADLLEVVGVELFKAAVSSLPPRAPPMALVALGGLGRRELAPFSDLDVTVVCEDPKSDTARQVADQVFYPLWDARLEVGHAVRSPNDFAALAAADDTARTAAVDWRPLAGDADLLANLGQCLRQALSSSSTRRYATESVKLWTQGGNPGTVYVLQPDIKSGPGGLREIHRVWWLARLLWKVSSWPDFLARGLVDRHGLDTLMAGRSVLLNLRLAMHFVANRRQDQLRFELQDDVAAYLAVPAGPGDRAGPENLLESFYRHAKAVRAVSTRVLERCAENLLTHPGRPVVRETDGFDLFRGTLTLRRVDQFETHPVDLLRIFRVAQRHGVRLYVHARGVIAAAASRLVDDAFRANRQAARLFVDIVSDPRDGGESLEVMHDLGVLERFMPEFTHVTGLAQRDLYHVHTVDAHLVSCARCAVGLLAGAAAPEGGPAPADIAQIAARVARPHVLVLGCLMHDIGKGHGHGHSERGAVMAREACARLYLSDEDVADIEFLVLEHLSMFRISQRRDLDDEQLVGKFASTVGSVERLDLLMVLSYADAVTTGPEAWSDWKGHLLRELYQRTRRVLRGHMAPDSTDRQRAAKLQEVARLAPEQAAAMQALTARLVPRHVLTHRAILLLRHLQAVDQAMARGAACSVAPDDRRGGWEIVVVGPDRPGLLADLSGVLSAWGANVDAAYISGTVDGLAIDTFVVQGGASHLFEAPAKVTEMAQELEDAALGHLRFAARLRERLRAQSVRQSGVPLPEVRVLYDLEAQSDATVVDVFAPDRVGFLHDVTRAIFQAGASITLARVVTEGERALDAFYLIDSQTGAPLGAAERHTVEQAIRLAAGGSSS